MTDQHSEQLSLAGKTRRDTMLDELVEVMKHTHHRRRIRRRVVAGGGCVSVLLLLWVFWPAVRPAERATTAEGPAAQPNRAVTSPRDDLSLRYTRLVDTDPTVVDRCRVEPESTVDRIDDRMLVETLASIGRPAGLIRYGGRVLLTHAVTDAALGLRQ
jgi:hypothetical protein